MSENPGEARRPVHWARGGLLLVCLIVFAHGVVAARLERVTTCRDVGTSATDYRPIGESTRFYTTEGRLYVWLKFTDVRGPHTFHFLWIDPHKFDSTVYAYTIPAGSWDSYYVWGDLDYLPSVPAGTWRVLVYMDGRLLTEKSFQMVPGWLQEMEPNDSPSQAENVALGDHVAGVTDQADPDWYKLNVTRSGQYYIQLSRYWSYPSAMLQVFASGDLATPIPHFSDRETRKPGPEGLWGECVLVTRPGIYYVRVLGTGSLERDYILSVEEKMPWWAVR